MRCALCHSEKPLRECGQCGASACKACTVFLDKGYFDFHPAPPKVLKLPFVCFRCHEAEVQPLLAAYDEIFERSQEIQVVSRSFKGVIPYQKKEQEVSQVKGHLDEKIAVAHLKFLAAWNGYDALLGMETVGKTVRRHGYEHTEWTAKGHFALMGKRKIRFD